MSCNRPEGFTQLPVSLGDGCVLSLYMINANSGACITALDMKRRRKRG